MQAPCKGAFPPSVAVALPQLGVLAVRALHNFAAPSVGVVALAAVPALTGWGATAVLLVTSAQAAAEAVQATQPSAAQAEMVLAVW